MLRHLFLPHSKTHKRAHLISWQAFAIYLVFFILLQFSFNFITQIKPGVLGIASGIDQKELINLTNLERQKYGLPTLIEDEKLNKAALAKAQNMFEENYWSHFAPSGKDPWLFINNAGYKFSYAGENLARNFYTSSEVTNAWMESPTHKANIVNNHYKNIGIAVLEGTLNGQKTTLVVQEFGSPPDYVAAAADLNPINPSELVASQNFSQSFLGVNIARSNASDLFTDPFFITRTIGLTLLFGIIFLLILDYLVLKKRAVLRVGTNHMPHLAVLSIAASALFNMHPGGVL